ncbi:conserved Plasmodium protein, unknown function [Plasmodium knowlesi strain H]|uniref:Uncharacterized protein n=3 Tax=Plasmodium knowlesi TaxID=5850 RepID=A0A5K1VUL2_PLAKH|nr:U3 small nucleolar RNA-associated protein 15, putative [Plasmodium knowlesi strain H]OTN66384.1 Uncharacterized protein PKNOH_S09550100 [Plasmodium knowlesi]CAA9989813.1 U3 small nucleolar RNA-associated protein 15, putative [Plasmodium knowlesi strain H]SBO24358.1 conserved Plasmodium protein, unknown function [Plasmodium knowlesi strain H]SBO26681.1 conserved Plasmodium protein, unknown function [Plasmodium knowlesi strain H]VVS79287.1 U3 small nucleolar RNA-associated protein 15, putativ|eukprot:XP_002259828.1 hypothetical protein, conserved in Plasmodium species [Plasmodium knowlesi strain H]
MSYFEPIILTHKKRKIKESNNFLFDFKVLSSGNDKGCVKSISICSKFIAIGCNNVVILNSITGERLGKKYQCQEGITKLKFRDEEMLGVGLENGTIDLVGIFCFGRIKSLRGHKSAINDLIFSSNFQTLYSCSRDFTIKIWNIWEGICERTLDYHIDSVTNICLYTFDGSAGDGPHLISCSYDGYVYLYNINSKKKINQIELDEPVDCLNIFQNNYIVLSVKNVIKFYKLQNLEFLKNVIISTKTCFYLGSFKHYLVAASLDLSIYFLDPFYKGMEKIKVVSIANFLSAPKSVDFSNGVLALGEMNGKWLIEVYNEKAKQKKRKRKDSGPLVDIPETIHIFTSTEINNYLKNFRYHDALMFVIKTNPESTLSLLDYFSKHKVMIPACRTYSIEDTIKVLNFFRKRFVMDILMFEFFFSFFYVNKWIATTRNPKLLDELNVLRRGFENTQNFMKYYQNLKDIADFLKS